MYCIYKEFIMFNLCAVGVPRVALTIFLFLLVAVIIVGICLYGFIQSSKNRENQKKQALQKKIDNVKKGDKIVCPQCASKNISSVNRGFSIIWGFWGSGETRNYCQNCGYKWDPKL